MGLVLLLQVLVVCMEHSVVWFWYTLPSRTAKFSREISHVVLFPVFIQVLSFLDNASFIIIILLSIPFSMVPLLPLRKILVYCRILALQLWMKCGKWNPKWILLYFIYVYHGYSGHAGGGLFSRVKLRGRARQLEILNRLRIYMCIVSLIDCDLFLLVNFLPLLTAELVAHLPGCYYLQAGTFSWFFQSSNFQALIIVACLQHCWKNCPFDSEDSFFPGNYDARVAMVPDT